MTQATDLSGELVLITGASRGIGRAIAETLGTQGAIVIGTATSGRGADSISSYLADAGIKGQGMVLDVADSDSVAGHFRSSHPAACVSATGEDAARQKHGIG